MKAFSKSFLLYFIVFVGLISTLLWIDKLGSDSMNEKNLELAYDYTYIQKRKHVKEVIDLIHSQAYTALRNGYTLFRKSSEDKITALMAKIKSLPSTNKCKIIADCLLAEKYIKFDLINPKTGISYCSNEKIDFYLELNSKKLDDSSKGIWKSRKIDEETLLTVHIEKKYIHDFVKNRISKLIRNTHFVDKDMYIWVNEIVNYEGGDEYAIRRIHPNLKKTEGIKLSTNTRDIKGNLPYLEELEGVKKNGEIFFEYYFKKKTNDEIHKKMAYAKLFKPFDWVIATGVYLSDIEAMIKIQKERLDEIVLKHYIYTLIISIFILIIVFYLLYKREKEYTKVIQLNEDLEEEKNQIQCHKKLLTNIIDKIENKDTLSSGHIQRVAKYALAIAKEMNIKNQDLKLLYEASLMHDIGKIIVPDNILLKPSSLTENEYNLVKRHALYGYEILSTIECFKEHAKIIKDHHERYDGKGYPEGKKGNEVSVLTQILTLADSFDAMTTQKVYRPKKSLEIALDEIYNLRGQQFAPEIVDASINVLKNMGILHSSSITPEDEFEQVRFGYYFKDSLTMTYNYRYLSHMLVQAYEKDVFYSCLHLFEIKHFKKYRNENGWKQSDEKLSSIVKNIQELYPQSLIFRVYDSSFLMLNESHIEITKDKLNFKDDFLDIVIEHLELPIEGILNINDIYYKIDQFVSQKIE